MIPQSLNSHCAAQCTSREIVSCAWAVQSAQEMWNAGTVVVSIEFRSVVKLHSKPLPSEGLMLQALHSLFLSCEHPLLP